MLSRSSEYAIRTLTWLAQQNDEQFHLARDMAEVLGIPAPFLGKVLQPLVSKGILLSQRGRFGGFRLALAPKDIPLERIVATQERLERMQHCVLGQAACSEHEVCPLHDWWKQTSEEFVAMLERTTLADLVRYSVEHPGCRYPFPMDAPAAPLPSALPAPLPAPLPTPHALSRVAFGT
jgi:Rrf2 family protein